MSTESWLRRAPDGSLMLHVENDGPRFLRKGAQAQDTPVTLDEALERYPGLVADLLRAEANRTR
jgi:hypothetical protein